MANERVRRPKKFDQLLSDLGGPNKNSVKPFDSLKSVMIFAAALAYKKELEPITFTESGEKIPFSYFSGDLEAAFVSGLALAVTDDLSILHPDRLSDQIEIFEKYACAGLSHLSTALSQGTELNDAYFLNFCSNDHNQGGDLVTEIFGATI